jgi:arylsulfatase A-like enzyme
MKYKILLYFFLPILFFSCNNNLETKSPNVIIVITDDQGYGDIGYNGNPHLITPNLDKFAGESIRFNNFNVSPVCAPTRSSLLTGRYSLRTGVTDTYNGGAIMSSNEITLAEIFNENNYKTGIFGKWHLGDNYPSRPSDQGFQESLIHLSGGIGQVGDFTNYYKGSTSYYDPILWLNNKQEKYNGYCSDIFTDEAIKFIEDNKDNQFFCYLSFNAPHTPLQVPEKYYQMYKDIDPTNINGESLEMTEKDILDAKKIYGMVTNIDENFGKLINKLDDLNLKENTIVIFMTDNGPQQPRYVSNLKGLKSQVYNGGIKVPFYLNFPKIHNEGIDLNFFSAHIDLLPTIAKLCDLPIPNDRKIDGIDLFDNNINKKERDFFSYWTRKSPELYKNISLNAGSYKLVGNTNYNSGIEEFELYNLEIDPNESENLIIKEKPIALEMKLRMDEIYNELISSKNLIDKPRINIGTINENPTFLNRNDASGQRGIWSQNEVFGFWKVRIEAGAYDFKFKFNNLENYFGEMTLELGNNVYSTKVNVDKNGFVLMKDVEISGGDYDLIPFFRFNRKNILPFLVEVKKL